MQEVFDRYVNYLTAERNASRYTVRNYSQALRDFLEYVRGEKHIDSLLAVDKQNVRDYLGYLSQGGYAKSSMSRKLSVLRSFYKYLMREDIIKDNPLTGISSPKLDKRLPSFLTTSQANRLIETPDIATPEGQRDRAMLELFYASGLRVSELAGLTLSQVSLSTNEIRVLGKGNKERMVLMGKPAANALADYIGGARAALSDRSDGNASLFVNPDGKPLTVRRIQKIVARYAARTGMKLHPHMLRHTFATHMLDGGADLRVVQELLGHASLSSTQIYTHVTKTQARKIYLSAHPLAQKNEDR